MSIMAKTPSGYKKIGSAYLGECPVDKVFNANGDVIYALQRELTGVPPLLFKGKEQSELLNYRICGNTETKQRDYSGSSPLTVPVYDGELYNYRIYGNTVNGESVGDRTGNLFDKTRNTIPNAILQEGTINAGDGYLIYAPINPLQTYTFRTNGTIRLNLRSAFTINEPAMSVSYVIDGVNTHINHNANKEFTRRAPLNANWIVIQIRDESALAYDNMLNSGSTPLPYEPYGYKVPITVTNSGTTSNEMIYLPEPIKMVGGEAEYVDFYSQKQYFADGTNTAVTIPALPISAGTNTVTVNTTVQPSSVEVSTDENVSVGDLVTSGQHAGEYKVDVTVSNGTDTLTTPIYLPEPIKMVGDEAEYVDYAEQKMHRVRKNLFDENIITEGAYIDKHTGDIVTGSTASNVSDFISVVPNNTYTLSYAYIKLSSNNRRVIGFYSALKEWVSFIEYSPSANTVFNINVPNDIYYIKVTTDIKMTNVMLNSGAEPLPYEPYIENTDLDVTLPALPTIKGTNTMSVDTEVQPSRMDIKGRIKTLT